MMYDNQIEIMKRIDRYIRGELNQQEIDELWIGFLEDPQWYDWFEAELHLINLIRKFRNARLEN